MIHLFIGKRSSSFPPIYVSPISFNWSSQVSIQYVIIYSTCLDSYNTIPRSEIVKMDEEMIKLCNVMSVELALKRELEYRKKMEALKSQHQNDLNPLIPAQGPPTQARKEDAELAPSDSQKSPMLQFSSSSQAFKGKPAFSCKACRLTFGSVFYLSCHIEGQQHKVVISQMKTKRETMSNPICCELCNSSCSSLGQLEAHLNGSRHTSLDSNSIRSWKRTKI
ncbi:hypothetical protein QVD17_21123 [Tagetes erecta]|uniref:C2H2-type domain-containing protein n=1 Tax=Tagetes erecta TaxID=13708 RepID=A0AAD8KMG3_TARER|nr:hypothetical protein QVD17_21123 [Tagetes erecta]